MLIVSMFIFCSVNVFMEFAHGRPGDGPSCWFVQNEVQLQNNPFTLFIPLSGPSKPQVAAADSCSSSH